MQALILQSSGFLQLFVDSCEDEGCDETALSWVITAVTVALVIALLMLAVKWLQKYMAINLIQKAWSRGQTIVLIIIGVLPVLVALSIIWYTTRNFFNYVGVGGLFKGVVFSWIVYVMAMFSGHLVSPWRREIL